jgi:hypothetical protein
MSEEKSSSLTIGDTTYKTSGNILFAENEGNYHLAESPILQKMDQAIQDGILINGMQSFIKKILD